MKRIFHTVAGILAGTLLIALVEMAGHMIYPVPSGLDYADSVAMAEWMQTMPSGAFVVILIGWAAGAFLAGITTSLLSKEQSPTNSLIAGTVLLFSALVNMFMIPHPTWFIVIGTLVFLPMAYLGNRTTIAMRTK